MGQAMPRGVHTATPSLVFKDCAAAIRFYERVFGATLVASFPTEDSKRILHGELRIGDSAVYVADEVPGSPTRAPSADHPAHSAVQLYLPDAEAAFARALANGARELAPVTEDPFGDRVGAVCDPFGQVWAIARHVRHVRLDDERDVLRELEEPTSPPA